MCYGFSPVFLPKFHAYATRQCSARSFSAGRGFTPQLAGAMAGDRFPSLRCNAWRSYTGWDIQRVEIVARLIYTKTCVPELWLPWNTRASVRSLPFRVLLQSPCCSRSQAKSRWFSSPATAFLAPLLVFCFATVGSGDSAPSLCCVTSGWPRMSFISYGCSFNLKDWVYYGLFSMSFLFWSPVKYVNIVLSIQSHRRGKKSVCTYMYVMYIYIRFRLQDRVQFGKSCMIHWSTIELMKRRIAAPMHEWRAFPGWFAAPNPRIRGRFPVVRMGWSDMRKKHLNILAI